MNNEIRNELIYLSKYIKSDDCKDIYLSCLLERFEEDLKQKKEDLEYQLKTIDKNMETLYYVKNELGVK